jgi:hypothetical protein
MNLSKPLDNFPVIRTSDPAAVRGALARVYAAPTLQLGPGSTALNARMNECRLPNVMLAYGSYGGDVVLDFPAVDCFLHLLVLRGNAEITCRNQSESLAAANSVLISPDAGYRAKYSADYEGLLLKIDSRALANKLTALTGTSVDRPLRVDLQPNGTLSAQVLRRYLPVLARVLSDAVQPLPAWWVAQTEQLLMLLFLHAGQHAYSHLLEQEAPDAAPWQVRLAESYIEANCQQAITLDELAKVTGVSAFSLFRAFRKSRGRSPMQFASQLRAKRNWQQ